MNAMYRRALSQYSSVSVHTGVEDASPHRLIQILLDAALARIAEGIGHMARREVAQKGQSISLAIAIVGGLRNSLNLELGGEIAQNLDSLYEYMTRRLLQANLANDPCVLEEVRGLLGDIKEAWEAVPAALQTAPAVRAGP
jgi:flagellar protein FliS